MVSEEKKYEVLKKYIVACRNLYSVAFTQWRLSFPSKVKFCYNELIENCERLMEIVFREGEPLDYLYMQNITRYKLSQKHSFMINQLDQIGWQLKKNVPLDENGEPLEAEDEKLPGIDDWVYPSKRMVEGIQPDQIYLPNKEIMFKLMRSCINWFFYYFYVRNSVFLNIKIIWYFIDK